MMQTPQRLSLPPKESNSSIPSSSQSQRDPEHKLVRTDSRSQTLHAFMSAVNSKTTIGTKASLDTSITTLNQDSQTDSALKDCLKTAIDLTSNNIPSVSKNGQPKSQDFQDNELTDVQLTSVLELRDELELKEHEGITELFREHCFVGCIDNKLAAIQHRTRLLLVDYHQIR